MKHSARLMKEEPCINVGITGGSELRFAFCGRFRTGEAEVEGVHSVKFNRGKVEWDGGSYDRLMFEPGGGDVMFGGQALSHSDF